MQEKESYARERGERQGEGDQRRRRRRMHATHSRHKMKLATLSLSLSERVSEREIGRKRTFLGVDVNKERLFACEVDSVRGGEAIEA